MGKITVDLQIMSDHALSFDQYLVLYHLHTGEFQKTENQWNIFDEIAFEDRFMALKKPGVLPVLLSLKHRKFIDFRADCSFVIVNKNLFNRKNSSRKPAPNILSFREEEKVFDYKKRSSILNSCSNLSKWNSPEFVTAWNVFEKDVRNDKSIKKPLTPGSAQRLAAKLIRLAGDDERLATKIIEQSNENTWRGFWPLEAPKNGAPTVDKKTAIASWYPEKSLKPA